MTTLGDNRKYRAMTAEEADKIMQNIALLEAEIEIIKSRTEKKIAELKSASTAAIEPLELKKSDMEQELGEYVNANGERFIKVRTRKTAFGTYGKRTVSNLNIYDEEKVLEYAKQNNLDFLYKIEYKVEKKAVEKAITDGIFPANGQGARIESGERIKCDVLKAFIIQAVAKDKK